MSKSTAQRRERLRVSARALRARALHQPGACFVDPAKDLHGALFGGFPLAAIAGIVLGGLMFDVIGFEATFLLLALVSALAVPMPPRVGFTTSEH